MQNFTFQDVEGDWMAAGHHIWVKKQFKKQKTQIALINYDDLRLCFLMTSWILKDWLLKKIAGHHAQYNVAKAGNWEIDLEEMNRLHLITLILKLLNEIVS